MERPCWSDYFQEICKLTATRSSCKRRQVGCLLVYNNRIVSQGYNGHLPKAEHISIIRDNHEMSTIHAEINAIADCARRGVSCEGCEAYITHYPCLMCFKMLKSAGIKKIYYLDDYNNDPIIKELCLHMSKDKEELNKIIPIKLIQPPKQLDLDLTPPKIELPNAPKGLHKARSTFNRAVAFDY